MLKKTGIVVATAATGLLAFTSFAFASAPHDNKVENKTDNSISREQSNECKFKQGQTETNGVEAPLLGALPGVPAAPAVGDVDPEQEQTQEQNGNCINTGDGVLPPLPPV